ncbi:MAG: hypothetical protein COA63_011205 [Methylophaga sp.]|nr:hypothetical protein [Methylophaga sp.]
MKFDKLFISEDLPYKGRSKRDKFLSRIFGIFNEEIIRIWCNNKNSPFIDLGRPTVYDNDGKHYTLDFLLKDDAGNIFLTEMKCEIEYQKYKYLTLSEIGQLKHHSNKRAFQLFLEVAHKPDLYDIKCNSEIIKVSGSALVWGKVSELGGQAVKSEFGLSHLISTESAVRDLVKWQDKSYLDLIAMHELWCQQLFSGLKTVN